MISICREVLMELTTENTKTTKLVSNVLENNTEKPNDVGSEKDTTENITPVTSHGDIGILEKFSGDNSDERAPNENEIIENETTVVNIDKSIDDPSFFDKPDKSNKTNSISNFFRCVLGLKPANISFDLKQPRESENPPDQENVTSQNINNVNCKQEWPDLTRLDSNTPVMVVPPDLIDTQKPPDVNIYQHRKTMAQGMMDIALLSANSNQLRYVLTSKTANGYFVVSLILISLSLILQVLVGIGLILNAKYNVKKEEEVHIANKINNYTVIGIFFVTIINVFIPAFSVNTQ